MKLIPVLAGVATLLPCFSQNADACRRHEPRTCGPVYRSSYSNPCYRTSYYRTHYGYYRPAAYGYYGHPGYGYDYGYGYGYGRPFLGGAILGGVATAALLDRDHHRGYYRRGYSQRGDSHRGYSHRGSSHRGDSHRGHSVHRRGHRR